MLVDRCCSNALALAPFPTAKSVPKRKPSFEAEHRPRLRPKTRRPTKRGHRITLVNLLNITRICLRLAITFSQAQVGLLYDNSKQCRHSRPSQSPLLRLPVLHANPPR